MEIDVMQILRDNAQLIEKALPGFLPADDPLYPVLSDAMRYSLFTGGKRIRPTLTLEFCRSLGGSEETALCYAAAIEMIHTYSLIHDDLPCMDNDDFRRGKPTSHKQFGEANALLAGDALLTHAFSVASSCSSASPAQNLAAVRLLADGAGPMGMVGGQVLDLMGEKTTHDLPTLTVMNEKKTGCLIRAACLLGCIAAGRQDDTAVTDAASSYAHGVGLAFQIVDDLLDMGEEDQKTTFLTHLSPDEARKLAASLTEQAKNAVSPYDKNGILCAIADTLVTRNI